MLQEAVGYWTKAGQRAVDRSAKRYGADSLEIITPETAISGE